MGANAAEFDTEVSTILEFIDPPLPANAKVLDCPCGKGFQAQLLASRGYNVIGIDGNGEAIKEATQDRVGASFVEGKFDQLGDESLLPHESVDAVLCIDRSFGYGATVKENEETLINYYKKLKPGGRMAFVWIFNTRLPYQDVRDRSEQLAAGQTRDVPGKLRFFSNHDGDPVEDRLPDDYVLPPEDEKYRQLQVSHYAAYGLDGEIDNDTKIKWADYLAVAHDGNPDPTDAKYADRKPIDAPVMRALARHAGLPEPQFKSKFLPEQKIHLCGIVIEKPPVRQLPDEGRIASGTRENIGGIVS